MKLCRQVPRAKAERSECGWTVVEEDDMLVYYVRTLKDDGGNAKCIYITLTHS